MPDYRRRKNDAGGRKMDVVPVAERPYSAGTKPKVFDYVRPADSINGFMVMRMN
jgi:hypothetical protein